MRKPWKPKGGDEVLIEVINEMRGNVTAVAKRFGISRDTMWGYMRPRKRIRAALESARETMIDNAESMFYKKVLDGNMTALIFFLKTQGYKRGWVEHHEVSGSDGGPVILQVVYDSDIQGAFAQAAPDSA